MTHQGKKPSADVAEAAAAATATEPSTAIVKSEDKAAKEDRGFAESDIIYADDEVPFGPLGIFPESYTELQAKVCDLSGLTRRRGRGEAPPRCSMADHTHTRIISLPCHVLLLSISLSVSSSLLVTLSPVFARWCRTGVCKYKDYVCLMFSCFGFGEEMWWRGKLHEGARERCLLFLPITQQRRARDRTTPPRIELRSGA